MAKRWFTPEHRAKIAAALRGRKLSPEQKLLMSFSRREMLRRRAMFKRKQQTGEPVT